MANFEKILRPFAGVDTGPRPGLTAIPAVTPDVIVLIQCGTPRIQNYSYSHSFACYMEKQIIEQTE